jgi:hypothetical protein
MAMNFSRSFFKNMYVTCTIIQALAAHVLITILVRVF